MNCQPMVSKTWAAEKTLEHFFNTRMAITPLQYARMVEALCNSAVAVGHELIEAARNEPHGACGTCARSDGALTALRQAEVRDHLDSPSPSTNEKSPQHALWAFLQSPAALKQRPQTLTALNASSVSQNGSARSCSLRLSPSPPRSTTIKSLTSPNAISGWCQTPFA